MSATITEPRVKVPWWTKGDWNGLFGLGSNVLLNVIVLTGLCLMVVNIPSETVNGRILPALGIALPLGNIWYTILARRLGRRENRTDVTALPYGPSVPQVFIVVFVVMLPIYLRTGDPLAAWRAGLAWASSSASSCCWAPCWARGSCASHLARPSWAPWRASRSRSSRCVQPPNVAGTLDRVCRSRVHPRRLDRWAENAVQRARRSPRRHCLDCGRLDRSGCRLVRNT